MLLIYCIAYSQSENDWIDLKNPDIPYLEQLTKEGIDQVRHKHKLLTLSHNEICYKAAKLHANYLKDHKLSHYQPENETKRTPQDRVNFFGAKKYYAGENIAMIPLGTVVDGKETYTYQQAADLLVEVWVNSPGHFKNIIDDTYTHTALGMYYDLKNNKLYAVQVFALVLSFTDVAQIDNIPANSRKSKIKTRTKYPFRLKENSEETKNLYHHNIEQIDALLQYENKSIFLVAMEGSRDLQRLIRKRKDGLALEFVKYTSYRCGNPAYYQESSRRNQQNFLNGELSKPIYRNEIYRELAKYHASQTKGNRKQLSRKFYRSYKKGKLTPPYWSLYLNDLPDYHDYYEINLVLIKKRKLTDVKYYTLASGKPLPLKNLPPVKPIWPIEDIKITSKINQINLQIPFELNKTTIPSHNAHKLLIIDTLKQFDIKNIKIDAFASIEGTGAINNNIQIERGLWVKNFLQHHLTLHDSIFNIDGSENWNLFSRQIRNSPLSYMYKLSKDSVKEILRQETNIQVEKLLSEQRKAGVHILYKSTKMNTDTLSFSVTRWDSLYQLFKNTILSSDRMKVVRELEILQRYLYQHALTSGNFDRILSYQFPRREECAILVNNRNWLLSQLNLDSVAGYKEDIAFCASRKEATDIEKYNYLIYLLQQEEKNFPFVSGNVKKIESLEKTIAWEDFYLKERINIKYNMNLMLILHNSKRIKDYDHMVKYYNQLVRNYEFKNQQDTLSMAEMHLFVNNTNAAYDLLKQAIDQNNYNKDILKLYLILSYQHYPFPLGSKHIYPFYNILMKHKDELTPEEWCGLFRRATRISFQAMDNETLRKAYCKTCEDIVIYD